MMFSQNEHTHVTNMQIKKQNITSTQEPLYISCSLPVISQGVTTILTSNTRN